ncbi:type II and III secretion system protein family protein [Aliiroseovarius lamellibrachiae]|uniref:type II and III secretion system protein family protein n=1 Tax=Aliiroseovarius lamellibrachiae TaxID=1924933 RepID=UPI001BE10F1C|nr:type II and III secretion system protein family protein [Aliiroseovarius lamellibrachiae]MBT2130854.1 type II and III secretion system protein family protein [Aliiroseovarius lamellibrachiae]
MKIDRLMKAALCGVAIGMASAPTGAMAETLRVMNGAPSAALNVPMNRAVVVESDEPFAELSIANPGIADISTLSDRTIYVLGKAPGRTTLTLLGGDGRLITNVEVRVAPDIAEFKERLRQILPGEQIEVRTANDGIVLSGTVSAIGRMDRAVDLAQRYAPDRVSNLMTVGGTQQVMLKVRFAEMQRSVRKALSSSLAINGGTGVGVNAETGTWLDGDNAIGNPITTSSGTEGGMAIGFNAGSFQVAVLLEALETKGVVRTLAEPNLTALSGQEASFLAGGEYPIPVSSGDNKISVVYKPFGIEMTFTPRVLANDLINLDLKAAVSGLDSTVSYNNGGFNVNAFRRRETSTVVELRDGESFAIAGLIEDDFRDLSGQVPWLGDIPILGSLFRSAEFERKQSELVIIVTAHLVTPTRGEALALPTDRIKPPSEKDLFLFGNTAAPNRPTKGAAGEVAKQDFSGSYGYVMED